MALFIWKNLFKHVNIEQIMLGNYWQHSINGRQMEANLRSSLQGIQENSSSDIKISTALALSKLPAANVVTGSVFSFEGAALKDQKNGFRQTVNNWLKEFPVGTTFTIDVAGVNLARNTAKLEFESSKSGLTVKFYENNSKKLDGLNPTIRIKVAIPAAASETGD